MKGKRQDSRAAGKPKKTAAPKDRDWFERKVAELKAELEKLPADRQEQLRRELEDEGTGSNDGTMNRIREEGQPGKVEA